MSQRSQRAAFKAPNWRPGARDAFLRAVAHGAQAFGFVVATRAMANTPVRGGFRSFAPADPKKKGHQIGGTLRRSIHSAVYIDGRRYSGGTVLDPDSGEDQNHKPIPDYVMPQGVHLVVGTNSGYGFWVHDGTRTMASRPFLQEGLQEGRDEGLAVFERVVRQDLRAAK